MLTDPPHPDREPLDLLVVGAVTIDRFAGGREAPGGSVTHIARAAAPRGLRIGVLTTAGPEPTARLGVDELRGLAANIEVLSAPSTLTFRHREVGEHRTLVLEALGGTIPADAVRSAAARAAAVLLAPLADELDASAVAAARAPRRGAILQGWLRTTRAGEIVAPVPLATLDEALAVALGGCDLLVASVEDLAVEDGAPAAQVHALRRRFGPGPDLAVTAGSSGAWFQAAGEATHHLEVPERVDGVPTVGAGDVFAAMTLAAREEQPSARVSAAMEGVVSFLLARSDR